MSKLEDNYSFNCPYCMEELTIQVDLTGGAKQSFVYDCEVCCQPIAIRIEIASGSVAYFEAEPES